jgi:sulfite exporter TauE/SafE
MCGPIVLAMPGQQSPTPVLILSRILYNFGRIITYTFFGVVFGLLGRTITFAGIQQFVTIAFGVVIFAYYFTPVQVRRRLAENRIYHLISGHIATLFRRLSKHQSPPAYLLFGILNGFLPCGFVYVALAGAISMGSVIDGALFMAMFGLGTMPMMLGTALFGRFIRPRSAMGMRRLLPYMAMLMAGLFIIRGLNLGYDLSPRLSSDVLQAAEYCEPGTTTQPEGARE